MKRRMARMAMMIALIIGMGCWFSGIVVMAKETGDENKSTDCLLEDYLDESPLKVSLSDSVDILGGGEKLFFKQTERMFDIEKRTVEGDSDAEKDKEESNQGKELVGVKEFVSDDFVVSGMKNLQIPPKLEIVIDPWEMDGKGQIYSEKYVIRNGGDTAGTLTFFNWACKSQESGKVIVRSDKHGLHDNEDKALYMEMLFGDDNAIVLSEQGTEYQAKLQPGEELTVCFAGEVNEYASENWKNDDVKVSVVYSWKAEEPVEGENVESEDVKEPEGNEIKEMLRDTIKDTSTDEKIEDNFVKVEEPEEFEKNIFHIDEESQTDAGIEQEEAREDRTKVIELSEGQEIKASIDSWKVEPDYRITSVKYLIRNIGEKTGIFSLSDFVCQFREGSMIDFKSIREEVQDANEMALYMELVLGNGDKVILTQMGSEYRAELKPGEEIVVQFVGVMNESMYENWEEDSVVVDAESSWEVEE